MPIEVGQVLGEAKQQFNLFRKRDKAEWVLQFLLFEGRDKG